jgi:6-pyruvoyltetrahydropterin/6-carboxytetrahydropterin synthase
MSWKVLVERGNLEFSSAHFITFAGKCEPLHGHNYGVQVAAEGTLNPDSLVLDFSILKDVVRTLAKRWDHLVLLPLGNPHLRITEHAESWEVEFAGEHAAAFLRATGPIRYVLPKWSVVALPIDNTTAERLAELFAGGVAQELRERGLAVGLERITVGISETPMQTGFYTLDLRELARQERAPDS